MTKTRTAGVALLAMAVGMAAAGETIKLPAPPKTGGMALREAVALRRSAREFADVEVTPAQLSELLWITAGVNRYDAANPDESKFTYPTAMNRRDMATYVFLRAGVYRYEPHEHALVWVAGGDRRSETGMQPFVAQAAVNLVFVHDLAKWGAAGSQEREHGARFGMAHTGSMTQNAYLYAASAGWAAVVRGSFDQAKLLEILGLDANDHRVTLVHTLGPRP